MAVAIIDLVDFAGRGLVVLAEFCVGGVLRFGGHGGAFVAGLGGLVFVLIWRCSLDLESGNRRCAMIEAMDSEDRIFSRERPQVFGSSL
jgi:hypothetical protein